ncbi:MAG TPA: hypothetical protein VFQ45_10635, partial [Longimicrobium sp.]|nr:hypothetical protein [Longimicrobium sp.]
IAANSFAGVLSHTGTRTLADLRLQTAQATILLSRTELRITTNPPPDLGEGASLSERVGAAPPGREAAF